MVTVFQDPYRQKVASNLRFLSQVGQYVVYYTLN